MRIASWRRIAAAAATAALLAFRVVAMPDGASAQAPRASPMDPSEATWNSIKDDIFKGRPILDGTGLVAIDAPARAEDAALVPIGMHVTLPPGDKRRVESLTLVIDENPAPVAATFTIGPKSGLTSVATRVRVDAYTYVHVVAAFSDGQLYGVKAFVKASGGCSAPAMKNPDAAEATLGQMKFRLFQAAADSGAAREAQVMLRHPNNSGMQMDQVTRLYVPAFFVQDLKIWQGDDLVLALDGGISIAEDPNIRFDYVPNGAAMFRVEARDTDNHVFKGEWPTQSSQL